METVTIKNSQLNDFICIDTYLNSCVIELTNKCMFRCDHCYVNKNTDYEIDFELCKKVIDELKTLNCLHILFTGGETLLYSRFKEIYLYAKQQGFLVSINTNAYLINQNWVNFFKDNQPYVMEISLYGYDIKSYKNYTYLDNAFEHVDKALKLLKKTSINVKLKTVLTKKNFKYLNCLINYSKKYNYLYRWDYIVHPNTIANKPNKERISIEQLYEVLKSHEEVVEYFANKEMKIYENDIVFQCAKNRKSIFINCNGFVELCPVFQTSEYNIRNSKIIDIMKKFQKLSCLKFKSSSKCKKCNLKNLCRFCPGILYRETGKFGFHENWHCDNASLINFMMKDDKYKCVEISSNNLNIFVDEMFEIIYNNMKNIIPNFNLLNKLEDKQIWSKNINANLNDYRIFVVTKNREVLAWFELSLKDNKTLFVSEVQIKDNYKTGRVLLFIMEFIYNNFKLLNKIEFKVNKNNLLANRTFTHLGAHVVDETQISFKYEIDKTNLEILQNRISTMHNLSNCGETRCD